MTDRDQGSAEPTQRTQKTQPKAPGVEPIDIPVPTREEFFRNLRKVAPPAKPQSPPEDRDDRDI